MPLNKPNEFSMLRRRGWLPGVMLLHFVACNGSAPPDFRVLRLPPVMSEAAEEEAAAQDGSPLADFAWSCDVYGAYVEDLRSGAAR